MDLDLIFATGDHNHLLPYGGDPALDGPGGVLAHAYKPNGVPVQPWHGDVHFDAQEGWIIRGQNLFFISEYLSHKDLSADL